MGLTYEPNSLIERRIEYERKRREEAEREAAWERERLRRLREEREPQMGRASQATPRTDLTTDLPK